MPEPRSFRLVDETNFREFHKRWAAIDRLWVACGDPEHWDAIASLRQSAREELRAQLREAVNIGHPAYLIPV